MKQTSPFLSIFFEPYVINPKDKSLRNRVAIPVFLVIREQQFHFPGHLFSSARVAKKIFPLYNRHVFSPLFFLLYRPHPLFPIRIVMKYRKEPHGIFFSPKYSVLCVKF